MTPLRSAEEKGVVPGRHAAMDEAVHVETGRRRGTPFAMNIDGATAVVFCEPDLPPPLSRGLFCLARSAGVPTHGRDRMQKGGRNKVPMPPGILPAYEEANANE